MDIFVHMPALFTLIPPLLGLKANIEMTLASRFSTQVNLAKIHDLNTGLTAILGNICLTQVVILFKEVYLELI
jgi:solute carrier family 41